MANELPNVADTEPSAAHLRYLLAMSSHLVETIENQADAYHAEVMRERRRNDELEGMVHDLHQMYNGGLGQISNAINDGLLTIARKANREDDERPERERDKPKPKMPRFVFKGGSQDWTHFRDRFLNFSAFYLDDVATNQQKKLALANCVILGAADAVAHLRDKLHDANVPFDELLELYEKRFKPESESALAEAMFQFARQVKDESLFLFAGRLIGMYARAYGTPTETQAKNLREKALINAFCRGLVDEKISFAVQRACPKTFEEAQRVAENEFAILRKGKIWSSNPSQLAKLGGSAPWQHYGHDRPGGHRGHNGDEPMDINAFGGNEQKCYFCDKPGHTRKNCYAAKQVMKKVQRRPNEKGTPRKENSGTSSADKKAVTGRRMRMAIQALEMGEEPDYDGLVEALFDEDDDATLQELTGEGADESSPAGGSDAEDDDPAGF